MLCTVETRSSREKTMSGAGAGAVPIGDGVESPDVRKSMLPPFTFTQLNAMAIITIFAFSGLVPLEDIAFVLFSGIYIFIMSKFAFPAKSSNPRPPVFSSSRLFLIYVSAGAAVGLVLPLAYIFGGVAAGHKAGVQAAAPHVFLLACQIFWEGVTFSRGLSLPVRAFVPIFYNTRRVFTILDWMRIDFGEDAASGRWNLFGRGLAVANLGFWCFNLFCFLLPVYLPRALRKYYEAEVFSGAAKDKRL